YINNPAVIAKNDRMTSINTCLQIDLTGQICSESLGTRQFSGSGGAGDFAVGASHAKEGKSIIAVHSTAKNGTISTLQPTLYPGSAVNITRNDTDYIVTEYGVAKMKGRCIQDRVEQLIAISHPDFRDELREKAKELMIW
ncbi:MAG: acetyl-CoA hydrolase, partial [Oscillospiraceae bacterium]